MRVIAIVGLAGLLWFVTRGDDAEPVHPSAVRQGRDARVALGTLGAQLSGAMAAQTAAKAPDDRVAAAARLGRDPVLAEALAMHEADDADRTSTPTQVPDGAPSLGGTISQNNRYVVDGIDTTGLTFGHTNIPVRTFAGVLGTATGLQGDEDEQLSLSSNCGSTNTYFIEGVEAPLESVVDGEAPRDAIGSGSVEPGVTITDDYVRNIRVPLEGFENNGQEVQ